MDTNFVRTFLRGSTEVELIGSGLSSTDIWVHCLGRRGVGSYDITVEDLRARLFDLVRASVRRALHRCWPTFDGARTRTALIFLRPTKLSSIRSRITSRSTTERSRATCLIAERLKSSSRPWMTRGTSHFSSSRTAVMKRSKIWSVPFWMNAVSSRLRRQAEG